MTTVRELVIQQLSTSRFSNHQINELFESIDKRLVLNLSATQLSADHLRLLKLGFGYRPLPVRDPQENNIERCVDDVVTKLGRTLRVALDDQDNTRTWRPILSTVGALPPSADTTGHSNTELQRSFGRVYKRFSAAMRQTNVDPLCDCDVVTAKHLTRFKQQLTVEFHRADGPLPRNLDSGLVTALRQLQSLVDERRIIIRKADKSRQICVLEPAKYDQAVLRMLSDTSAYSPTPFNMKNKCAALIKQCVNKFASMKILTDKQAKALLLYTDMPSTRYFYGLPKTHKAPAKWTDGMPPLRPICPDIRTETSSAGCFLAQYLSPLLVSIKSYLKNSYALKDRLTSMKPLGPEAVLLTSDVDSLYPSIPIGLALHRVVRKLNNKAPEFQLVTELLRIQLAHNYFMFQDKAFKQIKGLPMGKAWAPVVASIYMEEWECSLWRVLGFEPVLYVRYIDDIFAVFENIYEAQKFVEAAAVHDTHIRLSDTNIGRSVHFLDLRISITDFGRFETSLYRKESDLIVLIHQQSAQCRGIKEGVILCQLRRMMRLHTDFIEAGRCMHTFIKLMVKFRGLTTRRARFIWQRFLRSIRTGSTHIGRCLRDPGQHMQLPTNQGRPAHDNTTTTDRPTFKQSFRVAIPPGVQWRRINSLLDVLHDHLSGPQRHVVNNVRLHNMQSLPMGITLFKR
jgi:hypothetical protein